MNRYVLTLRCPDQPGIVRAFADGVVNVKGNIVDNQQFTDPDTGTFCLRAEFESPETSAEVVRRSVDDALAGFDPVIGLRDADHRRRCW